ncbi:MAG: GNAT family N-acetyltransferase [Lachnospiraceae bacterium]|nr:GNAT family N-acetyltransferase [Lachnospiraceae bacterium]
MNLIIRSMTGSDLEPLYELLSDPRVMQYLEPPYTREKTGEFLLHAGLSNPPLIYAVEEDGRFIGYVIYHDYDEDSAEIGWVLHPDYWRKGYATHLTKMLMEKAFSSEKQVVIECVPEQEVTRHIALKSGFSYEGVLDGLDVFRFQGEKGK